MALILLVWCSCRKGPFGSWAADLLRNRVHCVVLEEVMHICGRGRVGRISSGNGTKNTDFSKQDIVKLGSNNNPKS